VLYFDIFYVSYDININNPFRECCLL